MTCFTLAWRLALCVYPDILPQARQVDVAAPYVGTTADQYTDGVVQQEQLHRAMLTAQVA